MISHFFYADRIIRLLFIAACTCDTGFCVAQETSTSERAPIVLSDTARELHRRSLVVDGHNDLPWEIRTQGSSDFSKLDISQPQPELHTDIPRLREGGVGAQF